MLSSSRLEGVFCPVVTPFQEDLKPRPDILIKQCRWLLAQNVGLAVFGTNSEANSLSVEEKMSLLDQLAANGIDVSRMMPGTGCCALTDTVKLTRHAVSLSCAGVLMLPPFYYKNVSDEGLYASYSEVIERVGSSKLRIYLYHIPPISQVGLSIDLIERLLKSYPDTIVGIKDSSGDWSNTRAILDRGWDDFRVFVGSESLLLQNMIAGGAGCISATANINPARIYELFVNWGKPNADDLQQKLDRIRDIVAKYPMIPALKTIVAQYTKDDAWSFVRPPLVALDSEQKRQLISALNQQGFAWQS